MGTFHYGDDLDILIRYVADESVDVVYLRGGGWDHYDPTVLRDLRVVFDRYPN